jgi:ADP-ribosylation factor-binding protein GGA
LLILISLSVSKLTGSVPPLTVIDDKNGITVILNFGKEGPRPDVMVIVVTTISKNSSPISNYLFQAVVPKVWYTGDLCCLWSAWT